MSNSRLDRLLFFLCVAAVLHGAILTVIPLASRGLEYDEIWTLQHYVAAGTRTIFTDLETPNNHPLHSFLVKTSVATFGDSILALRLPAFVAGMLLVAAAAFLAWRLSGSAQTAALTAAMVACSGPLMHYAQTARGYSLQCLLLLLAATALAESAVPASRRRRTVALAAFVVAAMLAILTIPTGLIFLAALAVIHLCAAGRDGLGHTGSGSEPAAPAPWRTAWQALRTVLPAYVLLAALAGGWLCLVWQGLRAGQVRFGTDVGDGQALLHWVLTCGRGLFSPLAAVLLGAFFLRPTRPGARLAMGTLLLSPVVLLPITSAGPARVYLPLLPFAAIAGALALATVADRLRQTARFAACSWLPPAAAVLLAMLSARSQLAADTPVDWANVHADIEAAVPPQHLVVYPAGAGYPIRSQVGDDAVACYQRRLAEPGLQALTLAGTAGYISGNELENNGEQRVGMPDTLVSPRDSVGPVAVSTCRMIRLTTAPADTTTPVIAIVSPQPPLAATHAKKRLFAATAVTDWLQLNPFFSGAVPLSSAAAPSLGYAFVSCRRVPVPTLVALENETGGALRFFRIAPPVQP